MIDSAGREFLQLDIITQSCRGELLGCAFKALPLLAGKRWGPGRVVVAMLRSAAVPAICCELCMVHSNECFAFIGLTVAAVSRRDA
jgi:hypothetical protein